MSHRDKVPRLDPSEEDYEWKPPSEAEMKIIQAKRERQDKISKLMGDYLLKGYTMLGSSCDHCGTILLRDKGGKNYCVACSELDSDISKDDPALNSEAARRQVQEQEQRISTNPLHSPDPEDFEDAPIPGSFASNSGTVLNTVERRNLPNHLGSQGTLLPTASGLLCQQVNSPPDTGPISEPSVQGQRAVPVLNPVCDSTEFDFKLTKDTLYAKLRWATAELQSTVGVESSIGLCQLVKSCAEAIEALRKAEGK